MDNSFHATKHRSWAGPAGLLVLSAGILIDQNVVELALVQDGHLESVFHRITLLMGQVVLVVGGLALLAYYGVPRLVTVGALVVVGLLAHNVATTSTWHTVLDCSQGEGRCHYREIDRYYGTAECWQNKPSKCQLLRSGLANIALVADPTNYVDGRFTAEAFVVQPIPVDLNTPWDLDFLPDGAMLVTERGGRVVHINPDGEAHPVLHLTPLVSWGAGLMGMAVDPDFAENKVVYLYYTTGYDESDPEFAAADVWLRRVVSRISRFKLEGDSLMHEQVILDGIPGSAMHAGGRLEFGPDGML